VAGRGDQGCTEWFGEALRHPCTADLLSTTGMVRGHPEMPSTTDWIQAIAAAASTVTTCVALAISLIALDVARQSDERQDRQERQQYADKIYIGEAPLSVLSAFPQGDPDDIGQVVVNASGVQVEDVWVRDATGHRQVVIEGVQRCTRYALPQDFQPAELYFTDPIGHWRRPYGEQVLEVPDEDFAPLPERTDPTEAYADLPDCAG